MTLSVLMAPMPSANEMFMGPLRCPSRGTPRSGGVYRFLGRVWRLFVDEAGEVAFEQALSIDASKEEHLACLQRHKGILMILNRPLSSSSLFINASRK